MDSNNEFLQYFSKLENRLRTDQRANNEKSFSSLVRDSQNPLIKSKKYDLLKLKDIRNVISHNQGSEINAIPTSFATDSLKEVFYAYTKPPLVFNIFKTNVFIIGAEEKLVDALKVMAEKDISQIPIYEGKNYLGLLTGNVISRYFASKINESGEIVEAFKDVKIEKVLEYKEEQDQVYFISRQENIHQLIEKINIRKSPSGIYILSENGKENESPLRIITSYDYHELFSRL